MSFSKDRVYIGQTGDIEQRLRSHNSGRVKSTKDGVPWELVALEDIKDRATARWIERGLKKSKGRRNKWMACYAYGSESEISE